MMGKMTGKVWVAQSQKTMRVMEDVDAAMREGYIETLMNLIRHVREGKPYLRVLEFSVERNPTDPWEAKVQATGFESDEDYDLYVQRRKEEEEKRREQEERIHRTQMTEEERKAFWKGKGKDEENAL